MQIHQYKYYRILQNTIQLLLVKQKMKKKYALNCYNECEMEHFYMKWLIVDRLTEVSLMSL